MKANYYIKAANVTREPIHLSNTATSDTMPVQFSWYMVILAKMGYQEARMSNIVVSHIVDRHYVISFGYTNGGTVRPAIVQVSKIETD